MNKRILILAVLLLQACAQAPALGPGESCNSAAASLKLGETDREQLCKGASTAGPAACFERARNLAIGPRNVAISLCQCAKGTGPAECVDNIKQQLLMGPQQALQYCEGEKLRSEADEACLASG